jgi:hypothetical protein
VIVVQMMSVQTARRKTAFASGLLAAVWTVALSVSQGACQEPSYLPYDQNAPLGRIGQWSAQVGKGLNGVMQGVRIELPSPGHLTVYNGGPATAVVLPTPAQFNVGVGYVYRLKLSGLPDYPGVDLYPTIEILDRLHPPPGRQQEFPIPIAFTSEELQSAIDGRMVTKVVYLEQPQFAVTGDLTAAMLARVLPPDRNLLIEADRVGRPMVLVRLGGRIPDLTRPDEGFFLPPAPLEIAPQTTAGVRARAR